MDHFIIILISKRPFLYARLQTGRIMVWWCPSVRPSVRPTLRPPIFQTFLIHALTYWAEIFAHDFVLMYYRSGSSVVNFRQFLLELCPFWNLEYWKYTVFRTSLLHALTYWAEILHMTLFDCTTDHVRVSPISVNFCRSYAPFELRILEIHSFSHFLLHALTYWAEILHMILFYCTADQVRVSSISVNFSWELCPFWNVKYWKYSFPHFSLTPFDILSWNFAFDFVLLYYRSSLSVINFRQFFLGVMPLLKCRILKIHSFPHFSLTLFDMLSWNFAFDFILLYYRSSLSVVNFRQFL